MLALNSLCNPHLWLNKSVAQYNRSLNKELYIPKNMEFLDIDLIDYTYICGVTDSLIGRDR